MCVAALCMSPYVSMQGRFYVGGGGGGGVVNFCINITPNRNRKSCYSLRKLAILQMGIGYNEFITMFYIQATFKLKNP